MIWIVYDRTVMSVEAALSSPTKIQVLRVLSSSASAYSPQDLEKETTKKISVIYDAVRELEQERVIRKVDAGGKKNYYRLSDQNALAGQIKELFEAERETMGTGNLPAHLENIVLDTREALKDEVEGLKAVMLFGSVARGDFTPESDIDLYVVLEENTVEKRDRIYDILDGYSRDFSAVIRDLQGCDSDFAGDISELGRSIVIEGYSMIYDDFNPGDRPERLSAGQNGGHGTHRSREIAQTAEKPQRDPSMYSEGE